MELTPRDIERIIDYGHDIGRSEPQLRLLIEDLSDDAQAELVAMMWIGRGAFEPEEWDDACRTAAQEATTPCADYLLGSPHFADHLEAAAEQFEMA